MYWIWPQNKIKSQKIYFCSIGKQEQCGRETRDIVDMKYALVKDGVIVSLKLNYEQICNRDV